jgi:hypothetical protein
MPSDKNSVSPAEAAAGKAKRAIEGAIKITERFDFMLYLIFISKYINSLMLPLNKLAGYIVL